MPMHFYRSYVVLEPACFIFKSIACVFFTFTWKSHTILVTLTLNFFQHQISGIWCRMQPKLYRFLNTYKDSVFQKMSLFWIANWFFVLRKGGIFAADCTYNGDNPLKWLLITKIQEVFSKKVKLGIFFIQQNAFSLLKHLYNKAWGAENMPGHLVWTTNFSTI